jgi:NADH-quinone oxidoreductase subunit C/D
MPSGRPLNGSRVTMMRCSTGDRGEVRFVGIPQGLSSFSLRTRIRTPSFAHLQMIPAINRGQTVADLIAILGSIDFVMVDVDR